MYYIEEPVKWRSLKKYPCKRGKGEHKPEFVNHRAIKISDHTFNFYNYKCSMCGKIIIKDEKI